MPRAKAIATIIFGSQGIAFTPIAVPSNQPQESSGLYEMLLALSCEFLQAIHKPV
ncbi:hypothetical protein [Anabaena sp. CCY 9613]|uniref:hypothetical protein n=1 Tax=Anabaena sp. CCY 9613 TaxID=3103868 RepID=UPI0039C65668